MTPVVSDHQPAELQQPAKSMQLICYKKKLITYLANGVCNQLSEFVNGRVTISVS